MASPMLSPISVPVSFIGVTNRSRIVSKIAALPKVHSSKGDRQLMKAGNLILNAEFMDNSTSWEVSFLGKTVCLILFVGVQLGPCLFQAAKLD